MIIKAKISNCLIQLPIEFNYLEGEEVIVYYERQLSNDKTELLKRFDELRKLDVFEETDEPLIWQNELRDEW